MQTEYTILSIANRIHYIKHCKQNTLYLALHTEYIILSIATEYTILGQTEYSILSIAHRIHVIKQTEYTI